ncbi:MAG: hypothetical protein E7070_09235 [Bacteroidales bacterium]|nr:hypothetical protein [Bacteroidales bacterium]
MVNESALPLCKFYRGEEKCPFDPDDKRSTFWSLEETWIKLVLGNEDKEDALLVPFLLKMGGMDCFHFPSTLKATMFDQYCHFNGGDSSGFVDFIIAYTITPSPHSDYEAGAL